MPPKASSSKLPAIKLEQVKKEPGVRVNKKKPTDSIKQEENGNDIDKEENVAEEVVGSEAVSKEKIPLQKWLQEFTKRGVDMRVAMGYPTNSAFSDIIKLTGPKLQAAGIVDKEQKKTILSAVRGIKLSLHVVHGTTPQDVKQDKKRKRGPDEGNPLLPGDPSTAQSKHRAHNYDFNESHDIEAIRTATVKTNRAPCMTAWAYVILEKMGFDRMEALSLASVFTSVTSTQHALNLGNIYDESQTRDAVLELSQLPMQQRKRRKANGEEEEDENRGGNAQPWVGLMRRHLPVIQLNDGTWRGLTKGMAVEPDKAYSYITRNFAHTTPHVIGALRLLAQCYTIDELQEKGYGMYVSFRPEVQGWGDKAILYCANIIDMIPPEKEVDLAMHGTIIPQPVESKDQLVQTKQEEPDEETARQIKQEVELDVGEMAAQDGGFVKTREDVFEGFWEAEYDDEF